jgi:ankyrin repeat protein
MRQAGATLKKALEGSIATDDVAAVQRALEQGVLTGDSRTEDGNAALHVACRHGAKACLDLFLAENVNDVDVRRGSDGGTPLMYTAQNGHAACAERLLRAGAAVNEKQAEGSAALHYCCRHGHTAVGSLLLRAKGVDVNIERSDGITPLMVAAFNDRADLVAALIKARVDASKRSAAGLSALDYAAREGVRNRRPNSGASAHTLCELTSSVDDPPLSAARRERCHPREGAECGQERGSSHAGWHDARPLGDGGRPCHVPRCAA